MNRPTVAALIIGIDGWEQYTQPLLSAIRIFEPDVNVVVIDNASAKPYPMMPFVHRTERLCYSAAINEAHRIAGPADWYIVLSNDVRCTGPFVNALAGLSDVVAGPYIRSNAGYTYVEGWCVCIPAHVWDSIGGWDERFLVSSWEDVDFSVSAVEKGFQLRLQMLPFMHLDQRQRFFLPDYPGSENVNYTYMVEKHGRP